MPAPQPLKKQHPLTPQIKYDLKWFKNIYSVSNILILAQDFFIFYFTALRLSPN